MDPLSTTASVIAIVQLSAEVVQYINSAAGATKERKRLRHEIQACDDILQQLKDEASESEEDEAWSETIRALEAPGAPLGRLWVVLDIVKAKLVVKDKGGVKKAMAILKWPFEEKELEKIIGTIEREKSLLALALANESRKLIQHITKSSRESGKQLVELIELLRHSSDDNFVHLTELKTGVDRFHIRQDIRENDENRKVILEWLTPIEYAPQQNDFFHQRQPRTGQWLLDSTEYQTWIATKGETLFCPGIPGAGKTILTSIVVENLSTQFQNDPSIGIAYLYCNFRRQDDQKIGDLLSSLLKQLAQKQSSLPSSVEDLYNQHRPKRTRPSVDEISRTVQSVLAIYSRAFLIIDALDECQMSDGCQSRLIAEMSSLQMKTGANFLATSRIIPRIVDEFKGRPSKEILASDEDVARYIDAHVSLSLPGFVSRDTDLQTEIKTSIVKAVDGMFLLAKLHLDSLRGKRSPKAVRSALKKLATGSGAYDTAYHDAMERIQGQMGDEEELAKQVLTWITCAKRPLTTRELRHALAVEPDEPELDESNLPEVEDMVSVCVGLVAVDEESGIIRLVHYTTQDFFERTQSQWFPHAQLEITTICTTYLSFQCFGTGPCQTNLAFEERLDSYPLYDYVVHNLGHHGRNASNCSGIMAFLKSQAQVLEAATQVLCVNKEGPENLPYSQRYIRQITGLHLSAHYGLTKAAESLSDEHDVEARDSSGRTPLFWAAGNGHKDTVQLLLEKGADINAKNRLGVTPLSAAANHGHNDTIQLLLEKGVYIDVKDNDGRTPLLWAAGSGQKDTVQLLLEKGADINTKHEYGRIPLWFAAYFGHKDIVQLLLEKGTDINARDSSDHTPLWWAAYFGHKDTVQLLLEKGTDINARDSCGHTPLFWAVKEGHKDIVQLLLEKGVYIDAKDNKGQTPLTWAATNGQKDIVQLLLEKGVDINTKNYDGRTPLWWATYNRRKDTVQLLLEKGADIDAKDDDGWTPLKWAVDKGYTDIVRLLQVRYPTA